MSKVVKHQDVDVKADGGCYRYNSLPSESPKEEPGKAENPAAAQTPIPAGPEKMIEETKSESREIVENARLMAKKIKAYSVQKAQEEYRDAQKAGYEAGYREGKARAERENEEIVQELTTLLQDIDSQKAELISRYQDQLKDLALHIARKVVEETLQQDDTAFVRLFEKAAEGFHGQKWVKLTVSDKDAQFATANASLLLSLVKGAQHIDIAVQKGAPKGTCIVETPQGTADSSVDTQFKKLEKVLVAASVQE